MIKSDHLNNPDIKKGAYSIAIPKHDLHKMIDVLNDEQANSVYDFAKYLLDRNIADFWNHIDASSPDEEPLSQEEQEQVNGEDDYISLEEAKRELGI